MSRKFWIKFRVALHADSGLQGTYQSVTLSYILFFTFKTPLNKKALYNIVIRTCHDSSSLIAALSP
jgi:hypothetical protein